MKFFLDTANVNEIRQAAELGIIAGVTTNPSLVAKEGGDFHAMLREIVQIVDGPISAEVISLDAKGMVEEGEVLAKIHSNIVIKLPMTMEGLKAANIFRSKGIKTNVTLIFTANQALMAARAGATFVSPFLGRLDDISTIAFGCTTNGVTSCRSSTCTASSRRSSRLRSATRSTSRKRRWQVRTSARCRTR